MDRINPKQFVINDNLGRITMKLLHIDSSILGDHSVSRQLGQEVVQAWRAAETGLQVTHRDLGAQAIPLLDGSLLGVNGLDEAQRTAFQQEQAQLNDRLIAELADSDGLVIAAPMYNFSIPAGLRAWFDRVLAAGRTFRYTDKGPQGLLADRRTVLVLTAGGRHADTPVNQMHEGYLRTLLGFIGVHDIHVVRAEGLNMGAEARQQGLEQARRDITRLFELETV